VVRNESGGPTFQFHLHSTFPRFNRFPIVGVQGYGTIKANSFGRSVADSLLHRWKIEVHIQAEKKDRRNHDTRNSQLRLCSHEHSPAQKMLNQA
jgi:hypothetical protein